MVHYRKGIDKSQIGSIEDSVVVVGVFIEVSEITVKDCCLKLFERQQRIESN